MIHNDIATTGPGRVALVTGRGRRIGSAIARRLSANGHAVAAATAVKRVGKLDDVAAAVSSVLSEVASCLTGQVIDVCGSP